MSESVSPDELKLAKDQAISSILLGLSLQTALAQPSAQQTGQTQSAGEKPAQQQPAQQQPAQDQPQPPRIRTGINFVRVDIIVTDRQGNPVLDLKQDEFRIKEDGKPQAIESFSIVKINEGDQIDGPPPMPVSASGVMLGA